jgi:hypothetical protein
LRKRVARKVLRRVLYEHGDRLPRVVTVVRAYVRLYGGWTRGPDAQFLPYGWWDDIDLGPPPL